MLDEVCFGMFFILLEILDRVSAYIVLKEIF